MKSAATTVGSYLKTQAPERRAALEQVRAVILANLPEGYEESMEWGMPTYQVPLEVYPDTYNKRPLMYAGFASQKNHMAVYLIKRASMKALVMVVSGQRLTGNNHRARLHRSALAGIYGDDGLRRQFERSYLATGKKYDVGKSCVLFKGIDDLPLEVLGKAIAAVPMKRFVDRAKAARASRRRA